MPFTFNSLRLIAFTLFIALFTASCANFKTSSSRKTARVESAKAVKLEPANWNNAQQKKAFELGNRLLDGCNTSRFKVYTTAEASAELIQNITPEKIEQTCRKFNLRYGKYQGMKLVEVWQNPKNQTHVYRFKPTYSKKIAQKELRIIMDKNNKMIALNTLDWDSNYVLLP